MGSLGVSLIKQLVNQHSISEGIKRIWKQLVIRKKTSGSENGDGTPKVAIIQAEDKNLQELSSKIEYFRNLITYFSKGITIHQYLTGSTEDEEENIRYFLKHLTNLQDYLKTVPEYLQVTPEYKEGATLFKDGLNRYIAALKWHYAF